MQIILCFHFCFPFPFLASLSVLPVSVVTLCYFTGVLLVVRYGGGQAFYNLMIKSQAFSEPMFLDGDVHSSFFSGLDFSHL